MTCCGSLGLASQVETVQGITGRAVVSHQPTTKRNDNIKLTLPIVVDDNGLGVVAENSIMV